MIKDMTQGSPLKLILSFCLPLIAGNLFQQFYNMADSIIVGQFVGVDALAAVGATGSLSFLVLGFLLGMCSGLCIPIAQLFGARDESSMRHCVMNAIYLGVVIAVLLTGFTMLTTRQILELVRTPPDIMQASYDYIIIIFAGIFPTMAYNLLAGIMRALGDSKTPLYFLIVSSILNVALDLLFILVFSAGVAGAAWATILSQAVSALLCLLYIMKKFPLLHPSREEMRPDAAMTRRLLFMGLPMALQFSITAVGSIILQSAVNTLGSRVVAAVTAATKVQNIAIQPLETLGMTMATYCGQNRGAGRIDRIRTGLKQSLVAAMIYSVVAWAALTFCGTTVSLLFISRGETDILQNIQTYLVITSLFMPLLGLLLVVRNALQGLGFGLPAMAAGVFELVARAAVAFLMVAPLGYVAVCLSGPIAWLAADALLVFVYLKEMKKLIQESEKNGRESYA